MINVDKVVTISLRENLVRQKQAQIELAKLQLKTDFYLVDRDRGHEERGCFHSHVEVCKQALADGCQSILICEDDVKILFFQQKRIAKINHFIKEKASQFDILYLGLIIGKMWFSGYPSIARAKGSGAHAYILSRRGIEKLSTYKFKGIPIDKIMKHDFKCYSVFPIIAEQYPDSIFKSDISMSRQLTPLKDEKFWENNYRKQKWLVWRYFYKSFIEILRNRIRFFS